MEAESLIGRTLTAGEAEWVITAAEIDPPGTLLFVTCTPGPEGEENTPSYFNVDEDGSAEECNAEGVPVPFRFRTHAWAEWWPEMLGDD